MNWFMWLIALLGELHQQSLGYSFNIAQLFDGALHHEHLIILFWLLGWLL